MQLIFFPCGQEKATCEDTRPVIKFNPGIDARTITDGAGDVQWCDG